MELAAPTDACLSFDLAAGGQRSSQSRNFKSCAISSAFMLGMMVSTIVLLTVQHYGLVDASFASFVFAPTISRKQRVSRASGTSVGTQASSNKDHRLRSSPYAFLHQSIPTSSSQLISPPDREHPESSTISSSKEGNMKQTFGSSFVSVSLVPSVYSSKAADDLEEPPRTDKADNYETASNALVSAAEPQSSPWPFRTVSSLALVLLMIIISGHVLQQRRQSGGRGSMSGDMDSTASVSPMGMMTFNSRTIPCSHASLSTVRLAAEEFALSSAVVETMRVTLPGDEGHDEEPFAPVAGLLQPAARTAAHAKPAVCFHELEKTGPEFQTMVEVQSLVEGFHMIGPWDLAPGTDTSYRTRMVQPVTMPDAASSPKTRLQQRVAARNAGAVQTSIINPRQRARSIMLARHDKDVPDVQKEEAIDKQPLIRSMFSPRPAVLRIRDPKSRADVLLVGVMHNSPASIMLAQSIVEEEGAAGRLRAVALELCPGRWKRYLKKQPAGSFLHWLFRSEMQAAAEAGETYRVPLELIDDTYEDTNKRLGQLLALTCSQLVTPWAGGWTAIGDDLKLAYSQLSTAHGLPASAIFNVPFLVSSPVAFVRYLAKSPLLLLPLGLLIALNPGEVLAQPADLLVDLPIAFASFGLELVVAGRVLLVGLLEERNYALACNIRRACLRGKPGGSVVVVLGMVHCNGVAELLRNSRII